MTREEIDNNGDDMMIDDPKPKIENEFNVHYLNIYYGKFSHFGCCLFINQIYLFRVLLAEYFAYNVLQEKIYFLTLIFTNGFHTDTVHTYVYLCVFLFVSHMKAYNYVYFL